MKIKVTNSETSTELFLGNAEEFLEQNLYDDELEFALNLLENGQDEIVFLFNDNEYLISKEIEYIY